jgi:hypothetical protein
MPYAKALTALVIAALTALASALTDDSLTSAEAIQVAIAVTTAAGVWVAANVASLPHAKTVIAGILAALNLAVTYITDGISGAEWVNLALALIGVFAVWAIPNKGRVGSTTGTHRAE